MGKSIEEKHREMLVGDPEYAQAYTDMEEEFQFAREMLLEALDEKFSTNTPADIKNQIQALNNKLMLKRLHRSAIQSKDIEEFRQSMKDLASETESATIKMHSLPGVRRNKYEEQGRINTRNRKI